MNGAIFLFETMVAGYNWIGAERWKESQAVEPGAQRTCNRLQPNS